jgi:hypothetical protein
MSELLKFAKVEPLARRARAPSLSPHWQQRTTSAAAA